MVSAPEDREDETATSRADRNSRKNHRPKQIE
jgi:hypothetical protein